MKKQYEIPDLEINWLNGKTVLTESQEPILPGDRWEKDPFGEK